MSSPYDEPWLEPTADEREQISRHHGLTGPWEQFERTGVVHTVYGVGDVVVRIPRKHPEWIRDTYTEALAIPVAHATGMRTPGLVAFDNRNDILPVPYTVVERVIGAVACKTFEEEGFLTNLAHDLARLHEGVRDCPDPDGWLDVHSEQDFDRLFEELSKNGEVPSHEIEGLSLWIDELSKASGQRERVFVHGDLHAKNILKCPTRGPMVIDWGDAGWADSSVDFDGVPPEWLPVMIDVYNTERQAPDGFLNRVVLAQAAFAFRGLAGRVEWRAVAREKLNAVLRFADRTPGMVSPRF